MIYFHFYSVILIQYPTVTYLFFYEDHGGTIYMIKKREEYTKDYKKKVFSFKSQRFNKKAKGMVRTKLTGTE